MAQLLLKSEVETEMGMGVTIRFSAERILDSEEEAEEFGEDVRILSNSFAKGYGGEE